MNFVVQEHFAKKHHYDFRLEMNGVAKSWAVPKGMPLKRGERRLAIQVEDHDVDYMDFEGEIPDGYGAGTVRIWDRGEYDLLKRSDNEIKVRLRGNKLNGVYVLLRFPKAGENSWLIILTSLK
ncbi:DNA ligase D, 3-phosphoesterase domain protein [Archaeoglobus sulfaticallidus PM70-1]|uniref:DNA ligase D, 3-phosphoesterase domain protein n=1 Tax=Archaeoglobus sulfaticallidus PM70-1 TaxID=387631 RepID=N0BEH0_9EURY|nr:DNA polymerase ligase N-terminal domain-containing protein [Archaeoglobus sulfaticallidus]AGK61999.1 DNA ligase D, 3-phosphoesterase domain protein [Archaeoglobus sulfaticallidus PM70-1]